MCRYYILSALDLHVGPPKIQKYYFLSTGSWEYLEWCGRTRLSSELPKVTFFAKMTKMPLVSPRFNQKSNMVWTLTKQLLSHFYFKLELLEDFYQIWLSLTKFDLKLILGGSKNLNFDLASGTGLNQCHYKDYQILIPMNVHGSKSELEQPRYHENRNDAP